MIIKCKAVPKTKDNKVSWYDKSSGIIKVNIKSIPEKGKANEEIIEVLSDLFKIPKSKITIKRGHTAKIKDIEIPQNINLDDFIKE